MAKLTPTIIKPDLRMLKRGTPPENKYGTRTTIYINKPIAEILGGASQASSRLGQVCDRYAEILRRENISTIFSDYELANLLTCLDGSILELTSSSTHAIHTLFLDYVQSNAEHETATKVANLSFAGKVALLEHLGSTRVKTVLMANFYR